MRNPKLDSLRRQKHLTLHACLGKAFWRVCFVLGGVWLFSLLGCGARLICTNDISNLTLDPNGATCTRTCDCSNQRYEGYCKEGTGGERVCVSNRREECPSRGVTRPCALPQAVQTRCKETFQICQDEGLDGLFWGDCKPRAPLPEDGPRCADGIDNDCDGATDLQDPDCALVCSPGKIEPCYDGALETLNKGICAQGTRKCKDDSSWGACEGQKLPEKETCNGQDDDCNGLIDDGLGDACKDQSRCEPGRTRACYSGPSGTLNRGRCRAGLQTCQENGLWGPCEGEVLPSGNEVCDGQDNDCNGKIDDGLQPLPCYTNAVGCQKQGDGSYKCAGRCAAGKAGCIDGKLQECQLETHPVPEDCNGEDDDCDGSIDDGINQRPCFSGKSGCFLKDGAYQCVLPCRAGNQSCQGGKWSACVGESLPKAEICNNEDDDCDGSIDNIAGSPTLLLLNRFCYGGSAGCTQKSDGTGDYNCTGACKRGKQTCQKGSWGDCEGQQGPSKEICNGKDDDCDGTVDEELTDRPLCAKQDGVCAGARPSGASCVSGKWEACKEADYQRHSKDYNTTESCDTLDNDCDGFVDEAVVDCVTLFAGGNGYRDGDRRQALFREPTYLTFDSQDNLYVTDYGNYVIRKVTSQGVVSTVAGVHVRKDLLPRAAGTILHPTLGLMVADFGLHRLFTFDAQGLPVSYTGGFGYQDGHIGNGLFNRPHEIAWDNVNKKIYIIDKDNHAVRVVASNNAVTTLYRQTGATSLFFPQGVTVDAFGNVWAASTVGHQVFKISPTGQLLAMFGKKNESGYANGSASQARFSRPLGMTADAQGNVYIADSTNFCVRKIDKNGMVTTLIGAEITFNGKLTTRAGDTNGPLSSASFQQIHDIAFDSKGALYISEVNDHRIRKIIFK